MAITAHCNLTPTAHLNIAEAMGSGSFERMTILNGLFKWLTFPIFSHSHRVPHVERLKIVPGLIKLTSINVRNAQNMLVSFQTCCQATKAKASTFLSNFFSLFQYRNVMMYIFAELNERFLTATGRNCSVWGLNCSGWGLKLGQDQSDALIHYWCNYLELVNSNYRIDISNKTAKPRYSTCTKC